MKEQGEKKERTGGGGGVTFFQVLWSFLILYVNTASSQWRHESDEAMGGWGWGGVAVEGHQGSSATCNTWPILTSACFLAEGWGNAVLCHSSDCLPPGTWRSAVFTHSSQTPTRVIVLLSVLSLYLSLSNVSSSENLVVKSRLSTNVR